MRPGHFLFGDKGLELSLAVIEADANDFKSLGVQFFVGRFDVGKLDPAGTAPGGPEIEQHDFALELAQIDFRAIDGFEFHRQWFADRGRSELERIILSGRKGPVDGAESGGGYNRQPRHGFDV